MRAPLTAGLFVTGLTMFGCSSDSSPSSTSVTTPADASSSTTTAPAGSVLNSGPPTTSPDVAASTTSLPPSASSGDSSTSDPPELPPLQFTNSDFCNSVSDAYTKTSTVFTQLSELFGQVDTGGSADDLAAALDHIQQIMRDAAAAWQRSAAIAPAAARDDTAEVAAMLSQLADQLFGAGAAPDVPTSDAPMERIASVVEVCGASLADA